MPTAANINKSFRERRLWWNFLVAGAVPPPSVKGTPALRVQEPLVGPPSRYAYKDNVSKRVARDEFTGPSALAQRIPSKGKWRVPCDEKNRPLCDVFAIHFEEGDYSQTVWTDQRAMKFWRDHNEAIEALTGQRTTDSILRTWQDTLDTLHALWTNDTSALDDGGDPADYDEPPEEDSSDDEDDEDGETQGSSSQGNGVMDVDDDDDDMEDII